MMEKGGAEANLSKEVLLHDVIRVLEYMTSDWDIEFSGGIKSNTRLIADLAFESMDFVEFVVAIGEEFKQWHLPFEKLLMVDGRYVDDLRVAEVVDFLYEHLKS
jgi:acyl carrier protein